MMHGLANIKMILLIC